ncbi:MAG: hypothetical protein JKY24_09260 [Pseudomonadales bacterium]|nr:hypothetical protein [Pseudomonadales bacterium]
MKNRASILKKYLVEVGLIAFLLSMSALVVAESCETSTPNVCGAFGEYDTFECVPVTEYYDYGKVFNARVDYFLPNGCAPEAGWPVVWRFHGGGGNLSGSQYKADGYSPTLTRPSRGNAARVIKKLLESGFAVLAPHATSYLNWQTNWPWPYNWSNDYRFFTRFIADMKDSQVTSPEYLKLFDVGNMFAVGHSDGGAQASRMDRTWNEDFKAIALSEGMWSRCIALITSCNPVHIDWQHLPTLFMHAEADPTAQIVLAEIYANALETADYPVEWRAVIALASEDSDYVFSVGDYCEPGSDDYYCVHEQVADPVDNTAHDWLATSPIEVCNFFRRYLTPKGEDCSY